MEITTTMVRFFFPKGRMEVKSDDAQMFLCPKSENEDVKIWVPFKKLCIRENKKNPNMNEVIMPKWLFYKTELTVYVSHSEFVVTSEITEEQLFNK